MRYDILIIWGNGLNCVPEIVDEIAVYEVKDGKIVKEQFFYDMPPSE